MPEKDQLKISTIFDISDNKEVQTQLDEMGIDYEKDELILRREANREGKSRCYINDETVRLAQLKQIASHLIDIHGQHENQFLFQVKNHLFILDSYLNLNEILENYQFIFDEWKDKKEDYLETLRKEKEISQEKELLLFNINQLKDNLIPEETYYKLKQKLSTVENHGKISNNFSKIDEKIYHHIFPQMQEVISLLEDIDRTDASHQDLLTSSREILFALEDVKNKVGALTNDEYLEMNKVDEIHEQLAKVERVKKKYQMSIGDLYTKLKDSKEKINFLEDCSLKKEKKEKEKELQQTEKKLIEQAINLHMKRKAGLDELADKIKKRITYFIDG